jgi:hypothetical protein
MQRPELHAYPSSAILVPKVPRASVGVTVPSYWRSERVYVVCRIFHIDNSILFLKASLLGTFATHVDVSLNEKTPCSMLISKYESSWDHTLPRV